ncbi:sporulation integral membrane protein YlbJ [Paenibacillus sp. GCM10028914]|uniref:sporulation integral membrane protein YlbJ n=1 Tax=Paenibacillus sp. GCM10028914 TaxID=3273416 RepID=UPI003616E00B
MTMKKLSWILLITGLFSVIILMAVYPEAVLQSALRGLEIWWEVLFPSLFPFFVISEVLLGFGVVHLIGTLLDPLMKPLFRIPGSGGFVAAMGYVSGYPVGAKLTAKLWEQKMVNRDEGERLVAFTTSSDPIFLIGAVSIGFFHNPRIGLILALAHYGSGLIVGLLMRFHGQKNSSALDQSIELPKGNRIKTALRNMHKAREEDGRDLGTLIKHAVQSSLQLIIVVGGLVVFFSVFLELWTRAGVIPVINQIVNALLSLVGIPEQLSTALVGGLFEVTLGARYAGEAGEMIPLAYKAAAAAFILSWGGLSVHAQIASILNATNLRYIPFMVARLIHGVLAVVAVLIFWTPIMGKTSTTLLIPDGVSDISYNGYSHVMVVFCTLLGSIIGFLLFMEVLRLLKGKFRNFPR